TARAPPETFLHQYDYAAFRTDGPFQKERRLIVLDVMKWLTTYRPTIVRYRDAGQVSGAGRADLIALEERVCDHPIARLHEAMEARWRSLPSRWQERYLTSILQTFSPEA